MNKITEMFSKPIAHRGLHQGSIIENSLAAFEASIEAGLGFELDVHMIKDGTIVVFHDYTLKRLCGIDLKLSDLTHNDLKKHPYTDSHEWIPTLEEVLSLTSGRVPILIELKISNAFDPAFPSALLKVLDKYEYKDKIALQSFNPYAVKWLKANSDEYLIGQLSSGKLEGQKPHIQFMFKTLIINRLSHPDFVSYDINYLPCRWVKRARAKGLPIIAWTIDDELKRKSALLNADQYIFEHLKI